MFENNRLVAIVEISGMILYDYYFEVIKKFGLEPLKDRRHVFNFDLIGDVCLYHAFLSLLTENHIDFWVEFDGTEVYDYGKEGVNNYTES